MADIFRVPKVNNYTIISNIHFKDQRLSLRAKGLLSLILSLPEDWDLSLKGLVKICTEGRDAVANTIKELISFGYVKKTQLRGKDGKLGRVVYEIYEKPEELPVTENPKPEESRTETEGLPHTENPSSEKPFTENLFTAEPTQLRTKEIKDLMNQETNQSILDELRINDVEETVKINIEYDILLDRFEHNQVNEIVRLICDTVSCLEPVVKIGGKDYFSTAVVKRLLSLEFEHIEFVIEQFALQAAKRKIQNVRGYLLTMLFNAPSSLEHYNLALFELIT